VVAVVVVIMVAIVDIRATGIEICLQYYIFITISQNYSKIPCKNGCFFTLYEGLISSVISGGIVGKKNIFADSLKIGCQNGMFFTLYEGIQISFL